MIRSPNANPRDDDIECQEALEPAFLRLVDDAVAAGWSREQCMCSLSDLADHIGFDDRIFWTIHTTRSRTRASTAVWLLRRNRMLETTFI